MTHRRQTASAPGQVAGRGSAECVAPGMFMANGWDVSYDELNGDFDLDEPLMQRLLDEAGPSVRATPKAAEPGLSALEQYLLAPSSKAPAGSLDRLGDEAASATYGAGNIAANSTAALAGALQGYGERSSAKLLAAGIGEILSGRQSVVRLAPGLELYNSAQGGKQAPRVRLRVRGLSIKVVTQVIPTTGGPVTQWRSNGPQTGASMRAGSMTAQQMRNAAILSGERRLPVPLRWATGMVGGGMLTFAPSILIDTYKSIETDTLTGRSSFNTKTFLVEEAKSQSGNALGFGTGVLVTGAIAVLFGPAVAASAMVIGGAFIAGVFVQIVWNWTGGADAAEAYARGALR